jgi:hypothetical protein
LFAILNGRGEAAPTFAALVLASILPAQAAAQQNSSDTRLDAALAVTGRLVLADTQSRTDDDIVDGSFMALRLAPSVTLNSGEVAVTLRNAATRVAYFSDDRTDRWQNIARLEAAFAPGKATTIRLWGERSDNILTAEAPSTDEWEAGGEVEQSFGLAHRVSLGARWRERRYDDVEQSRGQGPRFDAEYRYRFAANHYAFLRGRYEEVSSAADRRAVQRLFASAVYQHPLARDLSLRPSLAWYDIEFSGRPTVGGGFRRDTVWSPEVALTYTPGPWRIAAEAQYIARNSSDASFDRNGTRFMVEVGYVF